MPDKRPQEMLITTGDVDEVDNLDEQVSMFACLVVLVALSFVWVFTIVIFLAFSVTYLIASTFARLMPSWIGSQST